MSKTLQFFRVDVIKLLLVFIEENHTNIDSRQYVSGIKFNALKLCVSLNETEHMNSNFKMYLTARLCVRCIQEICSVLQIVRTIVVLHTQHNWPD